MLTRFIFSEELRYSIYMNLIDVLLVQGTCLGMCGGKKGCMLDNWQSNLKCSLYFKFLVKQWSIARAVLLEQ